MRKEVLLQAALPFKASVTLGARKFFPIMDGSLVIGQSILRSEYFWADLTLDGRRVGRIMGLLVRLQFILPREEPGTDLTLKRLFSAV